MLDEVALSFVPLQPNVVLHLLECFGSARAILHATKDELTVEAGLKEQVAERIADSRTRERAEQELAFAEKYGIRIIPYGSAEYPRNLEYCPDAPGLLYVKGDIDFNRDRYKWVAVVGTRKMTSSGIAACEKMITQIAEHHPDCVIVSGLAYGIDSVAHRAAMENGLKTVAVVAHGLDTLYPARHRELAKEIVRRGGAIVTEYPSKTIMNRAYFLARNRIMAGISVGTVVVESPKKGGALVTADIADSYGREVFAFPGRMTDRTFEGCNLLIKSNKANLLDDITDLEYILKWKRENAGVRKEFNLSLTEQEQLIYDCFGEKGMEISREEIIERTALPPSEVMALLTGLEINGIIKSVKGRMYIKLR